MESFAECCTSECALMVLRTVHSMLDWPEHNHTSPTSTSLTSCRRITVRTVNVYGPPARNEGNDTDQRPEASACVLREAPDNDTATCSSALARPQTSIGLSRCTTM